MTEYRDFSHPIYYAIKANLQNLSKIQAGKIWMFRRQCFTSKHRVTMEECDMTHRGRCDFFGNCQIIDDILSKKKESVIILSWELGCDTAWAIKFTDNHDELERLTRISIAQRNLKMQGAKCQGPGQRYSIYILMPYKQRSGSFFFPLCFDFTIFDWSVSFVFSVFFFSDQRPCDWYRSRGTSHTSGRPWIREIIHNGKGSRLCHV